MQCVYVTLYLSVCTVCKAQVLYDGIYSAVFVHGGVFPRVETQVSTEQEVLPHRQSAHQDIILEAHG